MLNADAPDGLRVRTTAQADVAAGVDRVVTHARVVEKARAAVDRPTLDEPGRVERTTRTHVEVAVRLVAKSLAAGEDLLDIRQGVRYVELAAGDPADLAVRFVRREGSVDRPEPFEQHVEQLVVDV